MVIIVIHASSNEKWFSAFVNPKFLTRSFRSQRSSSKNWNKRKWVSLKMYSWVLYGQFIQVKPSVFVNFGKSNYLLDSTSERSWFIIWSWTNDVDVEFLVSVGSWVVGSLASIIWNFSSRKGKAINVHPPAINRVFN